MPYIKTKSSIEFAIELEPNAQEMFEKLGYRFEKEKYYIRYRKGGDLDKEVYFDLEYKTYNTSDFITFMEIDIDLHKAITKQLKELGWL